MDKHASAGDDQKSSSLEPTVPVDLSLEKDVSVQYVLDEHGKPQVESVKPIFRPPELISQPIKRHWIYVWTVIIVLTVLAWIFLFAYFSAHQAPYSAPVR